MCVYIYKYIYIIHITKCYHNQNHIPGICIDIYILLRVYIYCIYMVGRGYEDSSIYITVYSIQCKNIKLDR